MFNRKIAFLFFSGALAASNAFAHIGVSQAPFFANTTSRLTLTIPHGCEGADTAKVEVSIPEGITSTRPFDSVFGKAAVETNDAGKVTKVTWTRAEAVNANDDHAYEFSLRAKLPDTPFVTVTLPTVQTCRTADGVESSIEWTAPAGATTGEPAPSLTVYPARVPGWNKYTVSTEITDLTVFKDAEIVWAGTAAYSANAEIMTLIQSESGVTELTTIPVGTQIWVKY